jgi:hypothetical protein
VIEFLSYGVFMDLEKIDQKLAKKLMKDLGLLQIRSKVSRGYNYVSIGNHITGNIKCYYYLQDKTGNCGLKILSSLYPYRRKFSVELMIATARYWYPKDAFIYTTNQRQSELERNLKACGFKPIHKYVAKTSGNTITVWILKAK